MTSPNGDLFFIVSTVQDFDFRVWADALQLGRGLDCHRLPVALYVRNDNHRAKLVKLIATCGPVDVDDPQPAITIHLPDED